MTEKQLRKGDEVAWDTSQGETTGKVVEKKTKDFSVKGTKLTASPGDPRYLVESDKSGKRAAHKPEALTKAGK